MVDLLQRARELYAEGRLHDALEAAQAACDRTPKDGEAWWLLGCVSRHTGLPGASDEAFRRAARLRPPLRLPHRVGAARFQALVDEARRGLPDDVRRRLEGTSIQVQALPTVEQIQAGLAPDALSHRGGKPPAALTLFQLNHENSSGSERSLRDLIGRTLRES